MWAEVMPTVHPAEVMWKVLLAMGIGIWSRCGRLLQGQESD